MSIWGNEAVYGDMPIAADAAVAERMAFVRRTYSHLAAAIVAFVGFEFVLFQTGMVEQYLATLLRIPYGGLVALGLFMIVSYIANRWAHGNTSAGMQYAGLVLYIVAEGLLIAPLLWLAVNHSSPKVLPAAALTTLVIFLSLTVFVFVTKKDFSFLGPALCICSIGVFAFLLISSFMGLGALHSALCVGMVVISAGYVLFSTSNVLHHYNTRQHVAASLALFASIALMFWYILQIFMGSDD